MTQLQVIVHRQARVLTTGQLAESYGTDNKRISNNFNENKSRYKEGKHFFLLEGEDLKQFKNESRISGIAPNINKLYLWTEKGAWLHAKSLNTDAAWEAYEMLVDEYYRVIENQQQKQFTAREQLLLIMKASEETAQRVDAIEGKVEELHNTMRIDGNQEKQIQDRAKAKIVNELGGKETNAYKEISGKVFRAFWKEFKDYFEIPRYGELPKSRFTEAIKFIEKWQATTTMRMEIDTCNQQLDMDFQ